MVLNRDCPHVRGYFWAPLYTAKPPTLAPLPLPCTLPTQPLYHNCMYVAVPISPLVHIHSPSYFPTVTTLMERCLKLSNLAHLGDLLKKQGGGCAWACATAHGPKADEGVPHLDACL
eukprot:1159402-Pelagomonas_calceolata.AAC.2